MFFLKGAMKIVHTAPSHGPTGRHYVFGRIREPEDISMHPTTKLKCLLHQWTGLDASSLCIHSTEIPVTPTNYGKPNERKAIAIKRGANERDRIKLPGLQNTTRTAQYESRKICLNHNRPALQDAIKRQRLDDIVA